MKFCRSCGSKASDVDLYCMKCGSEIPDQFDPITSLVKPKSVFDANLDLLSSSVTASAATLTTPAAKKVSGADLLPLISVLKQRAAKLGIQAASNTDGIGMAVKPKSAFEARSAAFAPSSQAKAQPNSGYTGNTYTKSNTAYTAQNAVKPAAQANTAKAQPNSGYTSNTYTKSKVIYTAPQNGSQKKSIAPFFVILGVIIAIGTVFSFTAKNSTSSKPSYTAATIQTIDFDIDDIDIPNFLTQNEQAVYGVYTVGEEENAYCIINGGCISLIDGEYWEQYDADVMSASPDDSDSLCRLDAGDWGDFTVYQENDALILKDREWDREYTLHTISDYQDFEQNQFIGLWYSPDDDSIMLITGRDFVVCKGEQLKYHSTRDCVFIYTDTSRTYKYNLSDGKLILNDSSDQAIEFIKIS